jgi:exopolysaccharide production protein ExoZ
VTGILDGFGASARLVYGSCAVLIVLGLVERERAGLIKVPGTMALIGRASYAVYLIHLVAIGIAFKYLARFVKLDASWSWELWLALSLWGVLAGVLASVWLEQPSINFVRRRFSK